MDIYLKIKHLRSQIKCPVDIFGCYNIPSIVKDKKLYVLISLILSAQTKDEINHQTMLNLIINLNQTVKKDIKMLLKSFHTKINSNIKNCLHYTFLTESNFTLDNFINENNLLDLIKSVGCYNTKYKTIKNLLLFISKNGYPSTLDECLSIKGIGRKMSILYINKFYETVGISVDTHVHRICNLLEIVKTKNPDETSKKLENIIIKDEWNNFNCVFVGYGQIICKKNKPRCDLCVVKDKCINKKYQF